MRRKYRTSENERQRMCVVGATAQGTKKKSNDTHALIFAKKKVFGGIQLERRRQGKKCIFAHKSVIYTPLRDQTLHTCVCVCVLEIHAHVQLERMRI